MNLWAVVVNWNGGAGNLACLRSLEANGVAAERIVFVDNASSDGSDRLVRAELPGLVFLQNERNLGFGHGTNRGVEHALAAGARAVFLVNNDVVLPTGTLAELENALERRPERGIVGPRVLHLSRPQVVWAAGGRLTFRQNLTTLLGHGRADGERWRRDVDVDYVPGCAMLVRREVFERAGLLDGAYFAYHEDVDFCMKARDAGFGIGCVGSAAAYHDAHASTGGGYNPRRKYMMGVNTIWFLRRHGTPVRWLRFFVFDVLSLPGVWLLGLFRGRARGVLAKALGMWHGALGRRVTADALAPGACRLW